MARFGVREIKPLTEAAGCIAKFSVSRIVAAASTSSRLQSVAFSV
jgi:hypothetical protein